MKVAVVNIAVNIMFSIVSFISKLISAHNSTTYTYLLLTLTGVDVVSADIMPAFIY